MFPAIAQRCNAVQVDTERIDDYRSIAMSVGAEKLEKKDLFGKSDPYLEISRNEGGGSWTVIHRTEVSIINTCFQSHKQSF